MKKPSFMAHGGRGYDSNERFYNAGEGLKVKHTSGPWWVRGAVVIGDGYELADCGSSFKPMPEKLANAHLIASAPELLEALKTISDLPDDIACPTVKQYARQAIAKAEGRTA